MAIDATSAPGLYIVELPSNAHTIQAAPKSIAVFVGYTHPFKTRHPGVAVEVDSFAEYERQFGGLYGSGIVDAHVAYAVNQFFLNGGVIGYVVGLEPRFRGNTNQDLGLVRDSPAKATIGGITFTAQELTDLIPMMVTIDNLNAGKADITIAYGPAIESYRGITLTPGDPNYIEARIGTPTKMVSSLVTVTPPGGGYAFPASKVANQPLVVAPPLGFATTFSETDFSKVFEADSSLDKVDIFNLLLIPGVSDTNVCSAGLAFAERKHAFVILDPPAQAAADDLGGLTPMQDLVDLIPKSPNGAIYFPYLRTIDPLTAMPLELPPSGFVAGKIAATDQVGPWIAPAGLATIIPTTTGVVPRGRLTEARLGKLNSLGVNCLRTLPAIGTVIWGARTLVSDNPSFEQWKYVPVRRMALFIEQSLLMSLSWAVFQPNDDPLYLALRTSVTGFMLALFNSGAFEGSTPSQAFRVLCDRTTTKDEDRALGICNIIVAFRPLKPAEFVVIKIAQLAGQAAA
jgi:phage tail sheath protein FI